MNNIKIENAEVVWDSAVVMICNDCGQQFSENKLKEAPARIKNELKDKTKSEMGKSVKVVMTSCLSVCPENKIAMAVASKKDPAVFRAYTINPNSSGEEFYLEKIKGQ